MKILVSQEFQQTKGVKQCCGAGSDVDPYQLDADPDLHQADFFRLSGSTEIFLS